MVIDAGYAATVNELSRSVSLCFPQVHKVNFADESGRETPSEVVRDTHFTPDVSPFDAIS